MSADEECNTETCAKGGKCYVVEHVKRNILRCSGHDERMTREEFMIIIECEIYVGS